MACILAEQAQTIAIKDNLGAKEILERCHRGLLAESTNFNVSEAQWVIRRVAELLDWEPPTFDA